MFTLALVAFAAALALTLIAVPVAKRLARHVGLVDHPDKHRKLHDNAIPLVGGICIFLATAAVIVAMLTWALDTRWLDGESLRQYLGLGLAAALLLLIGIVDDRWTIRGRQKLMGQVLAVVILIAFGFQFNKVDLLGIPLEFGIFAVLVIMAWMLGAINSVNLLDGADGFATTLGILMSAVQALMALYLGRPEDAIVCAAFCGALVGFLRFNFPPASAYLGDSGSMLIGLFVGAMAIRSTAKEATAYAFLAALALLAIPLFDTMVAIARRRLTGRSIYTVDRGHLHHALMKRGLGPRTALLWFALLCTTTVIGGLLSLVYKQSEYALVSIAAVVVFLIVGRVFGFAEFQLIVNMAWSIAKSFVILPSARRWGQQVTVRLQGTRDWDLSWQVLREFAEKHGLIKLTLDLNLPWIHESFHATYRQPSQVNRRGQEWSAGVPLQLDQQIIGRVDLTAPMEASSTDILGQLIDVIETLEPYLSSTVASVRDVAVAPVATVSRTVRPRTAVHSAPAP